MKSEERKRAEEKIISRMQQARLLTLEIESKRWKNKRKVEREERLYNKQLLKDKILIERENGLTYRQIRKRYGASYNTISKYIHNI